MTQSIMIIGRLGADPVGRQTVSGVTVASFSIATDRRWRSSTEFEKDENGEFVLDELGNRVGLMKTETTWVDCEVWAGLAEKVVIPYAKKGSLVAVRGFLRNNNYKGNDGQMHYKLRLTVTDLDFHGPRPQPLEDSPEARIEDPHRAPLDWLLGR